MPKPKTSPKRTNKTTDKTTKNKTTRNDESAQAARERELRQLIDSVEQDKSGAAPPAHESAHDFVERRMRETKK